MTTRLILAIAQAYPERVARSGDQLREHLDAARRLEPARRAETLEHPGLALAAQPQRRHRDLRWTGRRSPQVESNAHRIGERAGTRRELARLRRVRRDLRERVT